MQGLRQPIAAHNVAIDRKTLRPDRVRLAELIVHRPVQFCLFLKGLLGEDAMERMMLQAIEVAKRVPAPKRSPEP
jgi:hypothetical protein